MNGRRIDIIPRWCHHRNMSHGRHRFNKLMLTGLAFLVIANLAKWASTHAQLSESLRDGGIGLLYGISFGFLLLGLRRSTARPCA